MTPNPTILVVDDDQELRKGLRLVLHQRGYRTLEAQDGAEARKLIDRHRPDLVILDLMMPRYGGLAVLEHFHGKHKAPPFILVSGKGTPQLRGYVEELGVVDYIAKPFSMDRLLAGVVKVVGEPESAAPAVEEKSIIGRCPGCGSRIKAPVRIIGQTRKCPGCKQPFVVTVRPPDDAGPKLVMEDGW
jgi:DNA-binding response OmpR family regulator